MDKCPRPYGGTLHSTKLFFRHQNELHGYTYVLTLKDGISGFCEFVSTTAANTELTVQALMDWFKQYGVIFLQVSDQGSELKKGSYVEALEA